METAMFSLGDVFRGDDSDSDEDARQREPDTSSADFVERPHEFPGGKVLRVREFSFHQHNANLLWPGSLSFADWLWERPQILAGRRVLELGSGTGALAIFLHASMRCDVTTSDYDDPEIEENIAANCHLNGIQPLPHLRHTWGEPLVCPSPSWDLIIASDILLYVKQYPNLLKTLRALLVPSTSMEGSGDGQSLASGSSQHDRKFIMSWKRRIPKDEERKFFDGCVQEQLQWADLGSRVFEIKAVEHVA